MALRIGRKADRSPMIVLYMQDSEGKEHIACVLRVQWLRSSLDEEAADRVAIEIMIEVAIEVAAGKLKTSPDMYKYRDRIPKERGCIEKGTVDGAPAAAGCTKKQHEEKKGEAEPKKRAENKRKVSATDAPEKSKERAAAQKKAKTVAVVAAKKDEESPKKLEEEFFDSFASEAEDGEVSPPDKIAGETAPNARITGKVAPAAKAADETADAPTKVADKTTGKGAGKVAVNKIAKEAKAAKAADETADKVRAASGPPTKAARKTSAVKVRAASPVARYACDFMDVPDIS